MAKKNKLKIHKKTYLKEEKVEICGGPQHLATAEVSVDNLKAQSGTAELASETRILNCLFLRRSACRDIHRRSSLSQTSAEHALETCIADKRSTFALFCYCLACTNQLGGRHAFRVYVKYLLEIKRPDLALAGFIPVEIHGT